MIVILSIVCIVVGIQLIYKPDSFWDFEHFLTVKDGEPTKFYLLAKRMIGVIAVLAGITGIVLSL